MTSRLTTEYYKLLPGHLTPLGGPCPTEILTVVLLQGRGKTLILQEGELPAGQPNSVCDSRLGAVDDPILPPWE